jgi:predicted PurR-regulated permease PerM
MSISYKIPFYIKVSAIFLCAFFIVFTFYLGQQILLPIVFATLIAILLNPAVDYLLKHKIGKIFSILIVVVLAVLLVVGILYMVSSQITMLKETFPQLKDKFTITRINFVNWLANNFNVSISSINEWINKAEDKAVQNFSVGDKLTSVIELMLEVVLLPVYVFLILYYKTLLLDFILKLFHSHHHSAVTEVLMSTKRIIQSYLVGLFIEMVIVATLNSAGLFLLNIDYALILGITGAIINVIPYIGGIVAIALPMIIAFVTKDSITSTILVFLVYIFIQFIDNHYLIPRIVASRVRINALIAIIVVLIGNAVCGVAGMFLSIPVTAIIKVVFDHITPLKPWGFLLGNTIPTASRFAFIQRKRKSTLL